MTRLNPLMRIEDHFRETLEQHESKLTDREIRRRSLETLGRMGIPPTRFRQYPHEFSGGMRQRIMIALALVLRPKLLVADEPTTSLDVIVEAQILGILADLRENFGTALLLITHNLGIVAEACDRVAVMYAGKIVEEGPARDVFVDPAHPYTKELLRSTISLDTKELHSIAGRAPEPDRATAGCRFHPRCPDAMVVCGSQGSGRARSSVRAGARRAGCTGRRRRSQPERRRRSSGWRSPSRRRPEVAIGAPERRGAGEPALPSAARLDPEPEDVLPDQGQLRRSGCSDVRPAT